MFQAPEGGVLDDRVDRQEAAFFPGADKPAESPLLSVLGSRQFVSWLAEQQVSLAFTTYQAGKLFLLGRKPDQAPWWLKPGDLVEAEVEGLGCLRNRVVAE